MRKLVLLIQILAVAIICFGLTGLYLILFGSKIDRAASLIIRECKKISLPSLGSARADVPPTAEPPDNNSGFLKKALQAEARTVLPETLSMKKFVVNDSTVKKMHPRSSRQGKTQSRLCARFENVPAEWLDGPPDSLDPGAVDPDSLKIVDNKGKFKSLPFSKIKWLIAWKWGWYLYPLCDYLGIPADVIISLLAHESAADPWNVSPFSTATGLGQWLEGSAKKMADKYGIPLEKLNRRDPYQSILLACLYFRDHMNAFARAQDAPPSDWAILSHNAGQLGAPDTAAYYGGVENTPFVKKVHGICGVRFKEAPLWAQYVWSNEQWEILAEKREIEKRSAEAKKHQRKGKSPKSSDKILAVK